MDKITFELSFNELHEAISNYVKEKAINALDLDDKTFAQVFLGFTDKKGRDVNIEVTRVVVKKVK
jgi:hypothetical protein